MSIGKRIKQPRLEKGISQKCLAKSIQCSPAYLSQIENGKRCVGGFDVFKLMRISAALNVSLDWLMDRKSQQPSPYS
jgi:transcriptional regulator with XRE-family HTH domain